MILSTLKIVAFLVPLAFAKSVDHQKDETTCGYQACHPVDPDGFNVHLIPHSHDDLGWLKTVDQYYFQDVRNVLSSVVGALNQDPNRRFVEVEIAYFKRWWQEQTPNTKDTVRKLINSGRLEIINGGWCMNDEANVMYQETIDQYTLGFRFLEDEFGACARPRVGWQIDTFGHSREQASINARLGFDGVFFMRVDYRDKSKRLGERTADLLWRGSASLGNSTDLFTHMFFDAYSFPSDFCFDSQCGFEAIVDEPESPDFNQERRVQEFAEFVRDKAGKYPTNNLLVVMGDDTRYQAAFIDFLQMDKLIKGFELFPQDYNGAPIKVMYSTPSCYTKAVNDYANRNGFKLDLKTDDFLPYATDGYGQWVGFFTSRPYSKRFERQCNNLLQTIKQLGAFIGEPYENAKITKLKEAVAVMQHHDAITGTEKIAVMKDYHRSLYAGLADSTNLASQILGKLITGSEVDFELDSCILRNVSSCGPSKNDKFVVVAYNPLSRAVSAPVSIPVDATSWTIKDPQGNPVVSQIGEWIQDFSHVDDVPRAAYELVFVATDIPAHGFNVYEFQKSAKAKSALVQPVKAPQPRDLLIGFEDCFFTLDETTGLLKKIHMNGVDLDVSQDIFYYESGSYSGAYIFVPSHNDKIRLSREDVVEASIIHGDVFQGVEQKFNDWTKQVIKVYKEDQTFVEIEWIVGPVDMSDQQGKEFVSVFTTNLATNGDFFTDSNGREMLKRTRNFRPTFDYTDEEPVAGNYQPISNRVVLKDQSIGVELAIVSDRAQGVTSLVDGQLEIMFQRICPHEDFSFRGDSLDETEYGKGIIVRGKHYLVAGKTKPDDGFKSAVAIQRDLAMRKFLEPWTFVGSNVDNLKTKQYLTLTRNLPENVNILSLESWRDDTVLLRIEHLFEVDEDSELSKEINLDLTDLFVTFKVIELQETTLGGNMLLEESTRLSWPGSADNSVNKSKNKDDSELNIMLKPMEIRTFWAKIQRI